MATGIGPITLALGVACCLNFTVFHYADRTQAVASISYHQIPIRYNIHAALYKMIIYRNESPIGTSFRGNS